MGGNSLSAGVGWPQLLWGANQGGLLDNNAGPPDDQFRRQHPYNDDRPELAAVRLRDKQPLAVLERPDVGEGPAHRKDRFRVPSPRVPIRKGWGASTGGQFDFNRLRHRRLRRSGQQPRSDRGSVRVVPARPGVSSRSQTIPVYPTFNEAYTAAWINDEFKVSDKLTLTLGCASTTSSRARRRRDQYSTFDPNTPNPGAGGIPGALIFAGERHGPDGQPEVRGSEKGRVGASRRLRLSARMTRTRFAAATGSTTRVSRSPIRRAADLGFQANLLAPNLTNGVQPAFYLDNGFPQNRIVHPPFIDPRLPTDAPLAVAPDGLTLPRFQNWSVTYQRQLTTNMMLDVSYIGNRGTRLNHHFQTPGRGREHERPERAGTRGERAAGGHQLASRAGAGITIAVSGFHRQRRAGAAKYPQYQQIQWRGVPTGREPVPRARVGARAPLLARACRQRGHTPTRGCRTTARRARRVTTASTTPFRILAIRSNGRSAPTTRRTCS